MPRMTTVRTPLRESEERRRRALRVALITLAWVGAGGCAEFGYNRIRLGQEQREYEAVFPADKTRRTPDTLCYVERSALGQTDAMVVLLTRDRRVAGKLHARHIERDFGFRAETEYRLSGELDLALIHLGLTGPIDALRAVADELTTAQDDAFVREAHGWVAGGLVRLVQHWPHAGDAGPAYPRLADTLEHIPAGGESRITVRPGGRLSVEYGHVVQR